MSVENEINANSAFNKVGVGVEVELGNMHFIQLNTCFASAQ